MSVKTINKTVNMSTDEEVVDFLFEEASSSKPKENPMEGCRDCGPNCRCNGPNCRDCGPNCRCVNPTREKHEEQQESDENKTHDPKP